MIWFSIFSFWNDALIKKVPQSFGSEAQSMTSLAVFDIKIVVIDADRPPWKLYLNISNIKLLLNRKRKSTPSGDRKRKRTGSSHVI